MSLQSEEWVLVDVNEAGKSESKYKHKAATKEMKL